MPNEIGDWSLCDCDAAEAVGGGHTPNSRSRPHCRHCWANEMAALTADINQPQTWPVNWAPATNAPALHISRGRGLTALKAVPTAAPQTIELALPLQCGRSPFQICHRQAIAQMTSACAIAQTAASRSITSQKLSVCKFLSRQAVPFVTREVTCPYGAN